jgi:hypothetical protein
MYKGEVAYWLPLFLCPKGNGGNGTGNGKK